MKKEHPKIRGVYEKVLGSGEWWIQYFDARGKRRRRTSGIFDTDTIDTVFREISGNRGKSCAQMSTDVTA